MTITGTNLSHTSAVKFGNKPATNITQVFPTQVTAVSPSGTGTVGVTVTTPGGTSNPVPFFYVGAPFESSLGTTSGPLAGGNTITLSGTDLSTATSVSFGGVTATPTVNSDSSLSVTVPAGAAAEPVAVSVTTAGGTNNGLTYVDDGERGGCAVEGDGVGGVEAPASEPRTRRGPHTARRRAARRRTRPHPPAAGFRSPPQAIAPVS